MLKSTAHIGLTGGIGSGKSTVAGILQKLGAVVIDADAISKDATNVRGVALPHIASTFGAGMVRSDGSLNREQMRDLVFNDPSAKAMLEAILHPLIRQKIREHADLAVSHGALCIVYEIPLLVESKAWRDNFDRVAVVDCSSATQQFRVMERNGLSLAMVHRIMANQATRGERLCGADIVLYNDGISLEELTQQVEAIAPKIGL